jgi:6-phosphogluconolactonase (cycloisomerase 2 family)
LFFFAMIVRLLLLPVAALGLRVYVGLYDWGTSTPAESYAEPSLFTFDVDAQSGRFVQRGVAVAAGLRPSWMAQLGDDRLYVVNEVASYDGAAGASVASFAIDAGSGALTPINRVRTGPNPVYATARPAAAGGGAGGGRGHLVVATYSRAWKQPGSLEVFPLRADGGLANASQVLEQPTGTHCADFGPGENGGGSGATTTNVAAYLLSASHGADRVYQYGWNGSALAPNAAASFAQLPAGTGPRHLAFGRGARADRVYVADEGSATSAALLTVCALLPNGTLAVLQSVSTLQPATDQTDMYPSEIALSDDGRFAYVSNRDNGPQRRDTVAVFALDGAPGREVTLLANTPSGGSYPRSMSLDWAAGRLLVGNQKPVTTLAAFAVDAGTGLLTLLSAQNETELGLPAGKMIAFVGLARVAAPTVAPTAAPTPAPTAAPTMSPTSSPTNAPTASPTAAPTSAPTAAPTAAPTHAPTPTLPTRAPPTPAPTPAPTFKAGSLEVVTETTLGGFSKATFTTGVQYAYRETVAALASTTIAMVVVANIRDSAGSSRRALAGSSSSSSSSGGGGSVVFDTSVSVDSAQAATAVTDRMSSVTGARISRTFQLKLQAVQTGGKFDDLAGKDLSALVITVTAALPQTHKVISPAPAGGGGGGNLAGIIAGAVGALTVLGVAAALLVAKRRRANNGLGSGATATANEKVPNPLGVEMTGTPMAAAAGTSNASVCKACGIPLEAGQPACSGCGSKCA